MVDLAGPYPLTWCVVANVAPEIGTGDGGLQIRSGLRRFSPGARLWVLRPGFQDSYGRVTVVGRHRGGGHRYINITIERRGLTGYRVRPVYSHAVYAALTRPWVRGDQRPAPLWDSPEQAQKYADWWNKPTLETRFDGEPGGWPVPDPPPLEVERNGRTYWLAHFNARYARYSRLPPPVEPTLP